MANLYLSYLRLVLLVPSFFLCRCGGAVVDDGLGGSGASGGVTNTNTGVSSVGGSPTTQSKTVENLCFGAVPTSPELNCVKYTNQVGPFKKDALECVFSAPMPPGYHLNPNYLKLYFDIDKSGKLEIPFVETIDRCPTTGTVGGWYASSLAAGVTTTLGLCGCTCLAAKKYAITVDIDCAGAGQ